MRAICRCLRDAKAQCDRAIKSGKIATSRSVCQSHVRWEAKDKDKDDAWEPPPKSRFSAKLASNSLPNSLPNSVSDGDSWNLPPASSSVSDSDFEKYAMHRETAAALAAEAHMIRTLTERDPGGSWERYHMLRSMGEQRPKAFRRPAINIGLDEAWGRSNKAGQLVPRPHRIALVRHGESAGNSDEAMYTRVPDWRIPLTAKGKEQAEEAGRRLRALVGEGRVFFYYSPYYRTIQTCEAITQAFAATQVAGVREALSIAKHDAFEPTQVAGVREEPRIAEQQFGNLQDLDSIRQSKSERIEYGRFFYRFPDGEAGLDVYSRVSSFISTLRRDHIESDTTLIIVTHGLALRLFLMAWFQWTVEEFETTHNPHNCGVAVMDIIPGEDRYRLCPDTCLMLNLPTPSSHTSASEHTTASS